MSTINKLLLSTGALYHLPIENVFSIAKEAGFDGLELIFNEYPETTNIQLLKSLIEKYNLPIVSVHTPMDNCIIFGNTVKSIITECTSRATELKATKLIVHPWRKDHVDYSEELNFSLQFLQNETGIKIFIENLPRQVGEYFIEEEYFNPLLLTKKYKVICLDTSHFATTGLSLESSAPVILNNVGHVHLSDSNLISISPTAFEDEHLPFGTGKLPLKWLLKELNKNAYQGDFSIELRPKIFDGMDQSEIVKMLGETVKKVKLYK